jgi:hypothetical protein
MPNHVTSRVAVTGPPEDIRHFIGKHIRMDEGEKILDFETVIPVPPEIAEVEKRGSSDLAYRAWYGAWEMMLSWPWVKEAGVTTRKGLKKLLLKRDPDAEKVAKEYKRLLGIYGVATRYDWNVEYWGTKWNSYGLEWADEPAPDAEMVEFTMTTAWSPPEPVFEQLADMYPGLIFEVASFDEGWNFACEGQFTADETTYECGDATPQLYTRVYGHPPEKGEVGPKEWSPREG